MPERFADIVLPLAQPAYTFRVAEGAALCEGDAVAVQFGARNIYTGIVWRLHDRRPDTDRIKTVGKPLYDRPLLSREQMRLWEWTADYYMCTVGEVMRAALPSLMKPRGADEDEFARAAYTPRMERYVAPAVEFAGDSQEASDRLDRMERRAPRRYAAMTELLELSLRGSDRFVPRRLLTADSAQLAALIRNGLAEEQMREVTLTNSYDTVFRLPELTPAQSAARDSVAAQWHDRPTVLLHGVTGSGKTEIYIHFIAETVARGGDVLMLVPEIALTSQLIERMERIFGSRVTAYHSRLTDRRRTETYLRLNASSGGEFVVGARSALWLPLRNLQLIIVDEEHDSGYKQDDPAPRYNARDCAVVLSRLTGCRTLLGSATPSLESYSNARSGKYEYVSLTERYGEARLPRITISDTLRAARRGERRSHFNKDLTDRIAAALSAGSQVMLFQNRRGFAPYVECPSCGWTARCPHCNVTLTLHKSRRSLECHYCGHSEPLPPRCPSCRQGEAVPAGFGTEKIAEEVARMFPEANVVRLDADSATSERAYREIIDSFERGRSRIMVGTQMITKGFDFGGVSLVGILNADNLLRNPDFRASERAFQLMMQVAGRAGRRDGGGEVVIQTSEPLHPVICQVAAGDYEAMAARELAEREAFGYPPYSRIVALTLRHRMPETLRLCAERLAAELRSRFGRRLLGPVTPPVDRIRNEFIVTMMLKIEHGSSFARARQLLREVLAGIAADRELRSVTIVCDVDPR